MHRVSGCCACILVWLGNNVKRRLINIYEMAGCLEERTRSCCWPTPRCRSGRVRGKGRSSSTHADPHVRTNQWTCDPAKQNHDKAPGHADAPESRPEGSTPLSRRQRCYIHSIFHKGSHLACCMTRARWEARRRFRDGDFNSFKHLRTWRESPDHQGGEDVPGCALRQSKALGTYWSGFGLSNLSSHGRSRRHTEKHDQLHGYSRECLIFLGLSVAPEQGYF